MGTNLKDYVKKIFGLTVEKILAMSEGERDSLYEKACDNEEAVACKCNGEECEELTLASDFTDWLAAET